MQVRYNAEAFHQDDRQPPLIGPLPHPNGFAASASRNHLDHHKHHEQPPQQWSFSLPTYSPFYSLLTFRHRPNSASTPNTVIPSPYVLLISDSHPVNIAIHMIFVPLIYATTVILLGLIPPIPLASNLPPLNLADLLVAVYAVGYILLEPVAGLLILPFHLGVGYYSHALPTIFERGDIAKYAAGANLASWVAQFAGHGLAEGRAPALFDNLFQVPPRGPQISADPQTSHMGHGTETDGSRFIWHRCLFGWSFCSNLGIGHR